MSLAFTIPELGLLQAVVNDDSNAVYSILHNQHAAYSKAKFRGEAIEVCFLKAVREGKGNIINHFFGFYPMLEVLSPKGRGDFLFCCASRTNTESLIHAILDHNIRQDEENRLSSSDLGWALYIAGENKQIANFNLILQFEGNNISLHDKALAFTKMQETKHPLLNPFGASYIPLYKSPLKTTDKKIFKITQWMTELKI